MAADQRLLAFVAEQKWGVLATIKQDGRPQLSNVGYAYDGDVIRVRTWLDSPVTGDTPVEWRFSDYRDFDGVRFPAHIERAIGGLP